MSELVPVEHQISPPFSKPDFVMFGIQEPHGGVILFASTQLTQAELKSEVDGYMSSCKGCGYPDVHTSCRGMHIPVRVTTLKVGIAQFTMIRAETYGGALRSLMETWQPPEPRRMQLPSVESDEIG